MDENNIHKFIETLERVTTAKPANGYLGIGKDGKFYWIYYAGMGSMAFHPVQRDYDPIIKELLKRNELAFNDKLFHVPFHDRSVDELRTASFYTVELRKIPEHTE